MWKKNPKWPTQKNWVFQRHQFSIIFGQHFRDVLGWVEKIDWCGSTYIVVRLSDVSSKRGKNTKNAFLALFWAYFGQPDNHIGWATWSSLHQFTLCMSPKNHGIETFRGQWLLVDTFSQNGQIYMDILKGWIIVDTFWWILVDTFVHEMSSFWVNFRGHFLGEFKWTPFDGDNK